MAEIIPVRIRTARKQHQCDSYPPCRVVTLTAAPGKWTLLSGPGGEVVMPP